MLGVVPLSPPSALFQLKEVNFLLRLKIISSCLVHLRSGVILLSMLARGVSSALQPLTQNKAFPPGVGKGIFNDWYSRELKLVADLFENGNFMSFAQLQTKYRIPHNHFFGFLQVRHFVKSNLIFPMDQPIESPIDSYLLNFNLTAFNSRKFISLFYGKLYSVHCITANRSTES